MFKIFQAKRSALENSLGQNGATLCKSSVGINERLVGTNNNQSDSCEASGIKVFENSCLTNCRLDNASISTSSRHMTNSTSGMFILTSVSWFCYWNILCSLPM